MEIGRELIKDVEYAEDFKDLKEALVRVFNDLTLQDCNCKEEIANLSLVHNNAMKEIANLNKRLNTLIGRLESSMSNLGEYDEDG